MGHDLNFLRLTMSLKTKIVLMITCYFLPLAIIILCYIAVWLAIWAVCSAVLLSETDMI